MSVLVCKFAKRHKKKLIVLLCIVAFLVLYSVGTQFITAGRLFSPLYDTNYIFSIALDRWQMNRVNKVELVSPYGVIIVQDSALARDIIDATMVATHSVPAIFGAQWYIRLYRGNTLIRAMPMGHNNAVEVYQPSARYFVWPRNTRSPQVVLSDELADRISQYRVESITQ